MGGDLSTTKSSVFQGIRAAQVIRAAVLIAVGVAIAFSAPLHRDLSFDLWLLGGGLALIGAATLLEYLALRGTLESWWIAARSSWWSIRRSRPACARECGHRPRWSS